MRYGCLEARRRGATLAEEAAEWAANETTTDLRHFLAGAVAETPPKGWLSSPEAVERDCELQAMSAAAREELRRRALEADWEEE